MKGYVINIKKVSTLGTRTLSIFVVGLLIALNASINVSVPAISDDDSDSTLAQSDVASNSNKHASCVSAWGQAIFSAPAGAKNEIIPLSAVCNAILGFTISKISVLNIQLRGPPLDICSFG